MKNYVKIGVPIVVIALFGFFLWKAYVSPTKVALVNFPNFQIAAMTKSLDTRFVKLKSVSIDEFNKLKKYDAVFVFAMGIRMTDDHREVLNKLSNKKISIFSTAVTDPTNNITNLDSIQKELVSEYLENGGTKNYRSLFNYVRKELDGKNMFTGEISDPIEISSDVLFHLDEEQVFNTIAEYETYYKTLKNYNSSNPKVAIIVGMAGPFNTNKDHLDSLIISLESKNMSVYPISSFSKRLEFLQEISPNAVIYMPHGRLAMGQADKAVDWLKEKNIPMFCPVTINAEYDTWLEDKQGMVGGFMSQSIVMPELDGGILPFALNAQFVTNEGLYVFKPIPGRLEQFTKTVDNYIKLQTKSNAEKKIAIYYFKGLGNASMMAAGLEVAPSIYAVLKKLKTEGYHVENLPENEKEFEKLVNTQGRIFGDHAEGNINNYLSSNYPEWIEADVYDNWLKTSLLNEQYDLLIKEHGRAPGYHFTKDNKIAVTRIQFGNIVLLPQPTQGTTENSFAAVHGENPIPPHHYLASYLWVQNGFQADAMMHFGTHGSLEFVQGKQVALSSYDWTDRLVGSLPHFYYYTIADVGEGLIAKRRSYATTITHLNPPFIESDLRGEMNSLLNNIKNYLESENKSEVQNLKIKRQTIEMGLHRDLKLDSVGNTPYTDEELEKIENFAEELCNEKINGKQYTLGVPFDKKDIESSTELLTIDPIAYGLANLDKTKGKISQEQIESQAYFSRNYIQPARKLVKQILYGKSLSAEQALHSLGITPAEIEKADSIIEKNNPSHRMREMMASMTESQNKDTKGGEKKKSSGGGHPAWIPKMGSKPDSGKENEKPATGVHPAGVPKDAEAMKQMGGNSGSKAEPDKPSKEELLFANSVLNLKNAIENIHFYKKALEESPEIELNAFVNGLNGGYIAPTPGGDFISNPNTIPTGRNFYAINVEATPTPAAWDKGVKLANDMIADYRKKHDGAYPKKVSFTLWAGSFVESEGATIAQILYMLGVEPIRDQFNRVLDLRLIPEEDLKRPRIDVVVQTSGQLRDIAASRLSLIQQGVELAAKASDKGENYVSKGLVDAEKVLLEKKFSPKEARELSSQRVFGGLNGMYGTGITGMVEAGDRWENEEEIASVYLNNMGAVYGSQETWGDMKTGVFEAALQNTEAVVQPRQTNTWGALSLDHVYEFMGGISLTVRNVTGNDPDAYFNDLRNRHNTRVQDLKSAIGVEARTKLFNPTYIKEQMKGGSSSANNFTEMVRNTYGWNVMKPVEIDNEIWDNIYDVYVDDKHKLGVQEFFDKESPTAFQEITAVMMETARKGYWDATPEQLNKIAQLHAESVAKHEAGCTGFICDNAKLREYLANRLDNQTKQQYTSAVNNARQVKASNPDDKSVVMEKEQMNQSKEESVGSTQTILIAFSALAVLALIIFIIVKRRRSNG